MAKFTYHTAPLRTLALLLAIALGFSSIEANAASHQQALTGQVLAGSTPIRNATITLFGTVLHDTPIFASTYSEPVAETRTDAEGRFSFDLSKAHATLMIPRQLQGPLVEEEPPPIPGTLYVIARGGDAGGGDNPAIMLATALGTPPPEGRVIVNELTTVVAAFSVGYLSAEWNSDNSYTARFPMAILPRLPQTSKTSRGHDLKVEGSTPSEESLVLAGQLVDPLTGRLGQVFFRGANSPAVVNTLADILHACVVSRGPGFADCRSLFKATSLPDPWELTPDNTLIAIESIVSKLGRTNSALFQLLPPGRPYVPVLPHAPTGWLLSLNFSGLGLQRPTAIFADEGDSTLWILNSGNQTLTELSTDPRDFTNPLLGTRRVPVPVRHAPVDFWFARLHDTPFERPPARPQPPGWFAKPSVWLADGKLLFLNADGTACASALSSLDLKRAHGLSGNLVMFRSRIFIANTGADELLVVNPPKAGCEDARIVARLKPPFGSAAPASLLAGPAQVVACPFPADVWITNRSASVSALYYYLCPTAFSGAPFSGGGLAEPEGIACDNDRDVWIANHAQHADSVTELRNLPNPGGPISSPPCLDGAPPGQAPLFKVDVLSPSSGFPGIGLDRPYGVAVDALGNVWVTNESNDSLTVFIGAGGAPYGGRTLTGG